MSSIEEIGALLGLAAFAGLAVLVFLTFQQARHLRRLRDWAGRAPERAAALAAREDGGTDEATAVADRDELPDSEEFDEVPEEEWEEDPDDRAHGRLGELRERMGYRWEELDRRMPVDPKLLFGGLAAIILGVGIATGGFGVFGGGDATGPAAQQAGGGGNQGKRNKSGTNQNKQDEVEVAVLNGTAPAEGGVGVPGIADRVSADVEAADFRIGAVDNAGSFPASVIMFEPGAEEDATAVADALTPLLGTTEVVEMTEPVQALADGAQVAVVVGIDDSGI